MSFAMITLVALAQTYQRYKGRLREATLKFLATGFVSIIILASSAFIFYVLDYAKGFYFLIFCMCSFTMTVALIRTSASDKRVISVYAARLRQFRGKLLRPKSGELE